ncbi:MAG: asparagine synthase (glutamine-hydrolyzing) [Acidobacteriota bacterium]
MCGISGVVGESTGNQGLVQRMNADLARRGPDAEGMESWDDGRVVLGHRRLSIFDLSELGRQPMLSPDRNIGLVFNGAVYNFLELRRELEQLGYRFKSQSDTEVILHGYDAWGADKLVARLRGMFAIAIWDQRARKLFLIRDRLGVKPLVYSLRGSQIAFASTVRALEAAGFAADIDPQAVAEFFEFGFITDKRAIYKNLHKVPPATIVEFSQGNVQQRQYWQETVARPSGAISFEEAVEETERIFLDAVKMRLEADVPVGALLSGGVDSSLVCWAIAKLGGNIKAFTVGTPGDPWDETPDAIATAKKLGIQHQIVEMSSADEPDISELIDAYGEPYPCSSALGMLRVSKAIKPSATVLLTGDGGDDCFLGYPEHKVFFRAQKLADSVPLQFLWKPKGARRDALPETLRRAAHFLDYASGGLGAAVRIYDGLPRFHQHGLLGPRLRNATVDQRSLPISPESGKRLLQEYIVYHRENRFTGEYMTKVDGGAMYYALEARAPFLDQELWNFAQALPFDIRLRGGKLKAVLREIARRRIGDQVASGKKRGFNIPVGRWLAGKWRGRYEELLQGSVAASEGWIDAAAVRKYLDSSKESVPNALWYIFVFESWMRRRSAVATSSLDNAGLALKPL